MQVFIMQLGPETRAVPDQNIMALNIWISPPDPLEKGAYIDTFAYLLDLTSHDTTSGLCLVLVIKNDKKWQYFLLRNFDFTDAHKKA